MFGSTVGPLWGTLLLVLLVAWAALLFGGFLFGKPDAQRTRRMPLRPRIASSLVLVVASWCWLLTTRESAARSFALGIALGMTCGAVGDLCLANMLPLKQPVLAGMGAFGLGHVAYIAAILLFGSGSGFAMGAGRWAALGIWMLMGLAGWYLAVYRGSKPSVLHWTALPYALLLSATAGLASGLALQKIAFLPLALGAALFWVSDLILAARLFSGARFRLIDDVIWLTYGPGQALIVYSIAAALIFGR